MASTEGPVLLLELGQSLPQPGALIERPSTYRTVKANLRLFHGPPVCLAASLLRRKLDSFERDGTRLSP